MFQIKNIKINNTESDSGWVISYQTNCITEWHRTIISNKNPEEIISELVNAKDFPGWTGVQFCKGISDGNKYVFSSIWDSTG